MGNVFAVVLLGAGLQTPASTPTPSPATNPFSSVQFMIGEWTGESDGEPGKGTVTRSYQFVLKDKFIHERNVSTYPPQPKNEKGEVHQHWSFISYDKARKALVLRQFHQEGFVNQFVISPSTAADTLVFESESLENIRGGWKARETYKIVSPDEFVETFEIATDKGAYEIYSTNRFKRLRKR